MQSPRGAAGAERRARRRQARRPRRRHPRSKRRRTETPRRPSPRRRSRAHARVRRRKAPAVGRRRLPSRRPPTPRTMATGAIPRPRRATGRLQRPVAGGGARRERRRRRARRDPRRETRLTRRPQRPTGTRARRRKSPLGDGDRPHGVADRRVRRRSPLRPGATAPPGRGTSSLSLASVRASGSDRGFSPMATLLQVVGQVGMLGLREKGT